MEDFRADAQKLGICAQLQVAFSPNTYSCTSVADYVRNYRMIRPTTPTWFSSHRRRFADMALVIFPTITQFNYDPESNDQRLDLSDLSGSTDLLVTPVYDHEKQLVGLSQAQCASLLSLKQATFSNATCIWHPEWPCLTLAGYIPYDASDNHRRFQHTGFNLPDRIGFA